MEQVTKEHYMNEWYPYPDFVDYWECSQCKCLVGDTGFDSEAPENKYYDCPKHGVRLIKKPVRYGLPDPSKDHSGVILGGCCVFDDSPQFGFECPEGKEVYFLKSGVLVVDEDALEE
jgi:hypothetical protein